MKLIDILNGIDDFNDDLVIYIVFDAIPSPSTEVVVGPLLFTDSEPPRVQAPNGMKYLLDIETTKEVIQVWKDWRHGKEPTPIEKCNAVLYFVENDAYLPVGAENRPETGSAKSNI